MNNIKSLFLLTLPLFVFAYTSQAQEIDSMMNIYASNYPQQKVYVHFDKSIYRAGETVWFKAYIFSGFEPSLISRNFFAELIDKDGTVIQRKVYPVVESSAAGDFEIPPTQDENLTFRAYTTWMLNFDTAFLFKKQLNVIGSQTSANIKSSSVTLNTKPILNFFPEGGDLVAALESEVAFKANDEKGKPVKVSGEVKNSKGETVTTFISVHNGMGKFTLQPAINEKYTAYYKDESGRQYTENLPSAKSTGVVLHITNSGSKKIFTLRRSEQTEDIYGQLNIIAHMGQQLVYRAKVPLRENVINSGAIPVENLPSGIMQVTVFNDKWVPLAERIVMVQNENYKMDAALTTPIISLDKRAKNIFELTTGDTLLANMSVAITDAEIGTKVNDENIVSGLLMSGDLKGYIHNPGYYFKNNADSTLNNLDLVLLTHGWRRYKWEDIARGKKPTLKYPNDPPVSFVAKVFGVNPSAPLRRDESMTVILQMKDSSTQVLTVPKTGNTEFALRNMIFYDTIKVFYQFDKDRLLAKNTSLLFDNGLYKGPRLVIIPNLPAADIDTFAVNRANYFSQMVKRYRNSSSRLNVLQEVFVKTKPKSKANELDKQYASGLFAGGDAITFDFVNDVTNQGYQNIFQYLQGRVAGLQISNTGADVSLVWRGSNTSTFLNEMPVDAQTISTISVADIAYIKVFRPPFFGAFGGGAGGAIAIYTRKGGDRAIEPGQGLPRGIITGYSVAKEFYSPNYSEPQQEVEADFRSTLYWNPFVFMDNTRQKVRIEFYNNDITKAYRVVVEGMNELGKLVHIEKIIQ